MFPILSVALIAAALRAAGLDHQSYTMDEISEIRIAARPFAEIIMLPDGFPPLYHLLLDGWLTAWGGRDVARWLSALLSLLSIFGVYHFGREVGGRGVGLAAAGITAVSPFHIWFAQEARAYALTLPLGALAFWLFARAQRRGGAAAWFAYAGVALAGLYSHYYFALLVGFHGLWLLGSILRGRHAPGPALAAHAVLALLALPLVPLMRSDVAFQAATVTFVSELSAQDVFFTLYAFLLGFSTALSLRELHSTGMTDAAVAFLPWILALGASTVLLVPELWRGARVGRLRVGYLVLLIVGPLLACAALATLFAIKFKPSYVLWAQVPLTLLVAYPVASGWHRPATRVAAAVYLALAATSLANRHLVERYRNEDLRALAAYLKERATPEAPIFVIASYMAPAVDFYLGSGWSVQPIAEGADPAAFETVVANLSKLSAPAKPEAQGSQRFWLVYTRPFHGDPHGRVREALARSEAMDLEAQFAGIELYGAAARTPPRVEDPS